MSLEWDIRKGKMVKTGKQRASRSAAPPCSLIVTDGDRVLCEDCHRECFCEQDPVTHFYATTDHGVCDSCGLEIKKANETMIDAPNGKDETQHDSNTANR